MIDLPADQLEQVREIVRQHVQGAKCLPSARVSAARRKIFRTWT